MNVSVHGSEVWCEPDELQAGAEECSCDHVVEEESGRVGLEDALPP